MSLHVRRSNVPPRPIRLAYRRSPDRQRLTTTRRFRRRVSARPSDEFWLLAKWSRSAKSLHFHAESLISWAPVEMLELPVSAEDECGQQWMICKFRYFGPYSERDHLMASIRSSLDTLTDWTSADTIALD